MKKFLMLAVMAGMLAGVGTQVGADHCTADNGQLAFCQWGTGCFTVNNDYAPNIGAECSALISNCKSAGTLYTGASVPSALASPPYGDGAQCSAVGGLTVAEGSAVVEQCQTSGGAQLYCQWNTGCYEINNSGTNAGKTCPELESACSADGQLFTGVTGLNAENNYGEGVQCAAAGGSTYTNVRLIANAKSTPGLRVSYAKNRVIVNWTPAAKVSGGTIQLINAKGAVLSTAFIRGSGGKVTAKLGTVGVPAGMYFVHINAVGQNGQKIVSQSAVSVVK